MYTVETTTTAEKNLASLPFDIKRKYFERMLILQSDPFCGKKLVGELKGYYSLRAWPYRIIYTVNKKSKTVTVCAVEHRREVYRL